MKISEIENKNVKIGATSLSVKDDKGKFLGIVRDAIRWKELSPRTTQALWKKLRESGLWGTEWVNNVVFYDGELYYLHDLGADQHYFKLKEILDDCEFLENDTKRFNNRQDIKNRAESNGIKVMSCYLI